MTDRAAVTVAVTALLAALTLARASRPWPTAGRRAGPPPRPGRRRAADATVTSTDVAALAELVATGVRAGLPPARVWAVLAEHAPVAAVRRTAAAVSAAVEAGVTPSAMLRAEAAAAPDGRSRASLSRLSVALAVVERSGSPPAEVLERFARAVRQEQVAQDEREAALAGPRATAGVLTGLPVVGALVGTALGADPGHALLGTTPGRWCLAAGLAAWVAGRWWVNRLVRAAERAGAGPA